MTLTPQENEAMIVKKALECEYPCGSILKAEVRRLLEREKALVRALEPIANPQCGCQVKTPCRCLEPGALEIYREFAREAATAALSALNPGEIRP